jgi:hypothetical protein
MYKINNKDVPELILESLPQKVEDRSAYITRYGDNLDLAKTRTAIYHNSYFPQTIRDWNNLEKETRNATCFENFSEQLKPETKQKDRYYAGTRKGSILHTRLRTQNSDLNSHLFNINLVPNPKCMCGAGDETTEHYLLVCDNYDQERLEMLNDLYLLTDTVNTKTLLYGDDDLDEPTNCDLFCYVQRYLLRTKRFER